MTDEIESIDQPENLSLAKKLYPIAWVLTIAVLGLVGFMRRADKFDIGIELDILPPVHALLNSCVAVLLVFALIAIKQRNVKAHREAISAAMMFSATFLLCYVAYHFTTASQVREDHLADVVLRSGDGADLLPDAASVLLITSGAGRNLRRVPSLQMECVQKRR